jgi:membrane associated rhomboid family serine protease
MVMPLYDDNPFKLPHKPVMSWSLLCITIIAYVLEFSINDDPLVTVNRWGLLPASLTGSYVFPGAITSLLTLFTYQFLHADITHLAGNMIFVWVFADNVEEALGPWRFLAFYLLVGALAGAVFAFSDPSSKVPLVGASGSIAGVVIAYLMLRPCAKLTAVVFLIPLRISAYWIIGVFIALQVINLDSTARSDVAWWCHVGGMLAGAALLPLLRLPGVKLFECIRGGDAPMAPAQTMPTAHWPHPPS